MHAIQTAHPETNGQSVVDLLGPRESYPTIPGTDIILSPDFGIGSLAFTAFFVAVAIAAWAGIRALTMMAQYAIRGYAWAMPFEADLIVKVYLKTGIPLVPAFVYGGLPLAHGSRFAVRLDRWQVERAEFEDEVEAAAWLAS